MFLIGKFVDNTENFPVKHSNMLLSIMGYSALSINNYQSMVM